MTYDNTQKYQVAKHIYMFGNITSWEAITRYRITRLSEYVRSLRQDGLNITSKWQKHGNKRFVKYILENNTQGAAI